MDLEINGKDAVFAVDTGSPFGFAVDKSWAKRNGLNIEKKKGRETVRFGARIGVHTENVEAMVLEFPSFDIDGLIGLPALQQKIWRLQCDKGTITPIPSVPKHASRWMQFDLATNVPVVALHPRIEGEGLVYIDTGSPLGVFLSDARWEQWLKTHPGAPKTVYAFSSPAAGGVAAGEQSWAEHIAIGDLTLPGTMVQRSEIEWPRVEALLGMDVLSGFEIILDFHEDKIYLETHDHYRKPPPYNRLGAVFFPESVESSFLTALVLTNSPAYGYGIRNGDILLKVDDFDMTKWKHDPRYVKMKSWTTDPAGTKHNLQIRRKGKIIDCQVWTKEILPVSRNKKKHNQ